MTDKTQDLLLQLAKELERVFLYLAPEICISEKVDRMLLDTKCLAIINEMFSLGFNPYLRELDDMEEEQPRKRVCLQAKRLI